MRHSDIDLTMQTYTDPMLLDKAGAVEALPSLPPVIQTPQETAAVLAATGTDGPASTPVVESSPKVSPKSPSCGSQPVEGSSVAHGKPTVLSLETGVRIPVGVVRFAYSGPSTALLGRPGVAPQTRRPASCLGSGPLSAKRIEAAGRRRARGFEGSRPASAMPRRAGASREAGDPGPREGAGATECGRIPVGVVRFG